MFLNFPLHKSLQVFSGVDATPFKKELNMENKRTCWLHWIRTWMGSRPSPYNAVLYYYLVEEFIQGNPVDETNPFFWNTVLLNLPGAADSDPT
jgi:hypothetical protein